MLKLSTINKELSRRGLDLKLYKGDEYFYFDGDAIEKAGFRVSPVPVTRLNDLSMSEWLLEAMYCLDPNFDGVI